MANPRPFQQYSENSIIFDNGSIVEFTGINDTYINGQLVTVAEFMEYLLSDQYKIDNGYDLE